MSNLKEEYNQMKRSICLMSDWDFPQEQLNIMLCDLCILGEYIELEELLSED